MSREGTGILPGPSPSPISHPIPLADYQTLRIGGLVFAVVLFSVGILLILSKFLFSFVHPIRAVSALLSRKRMMQEPGCSLFWREKESVSFPCYFQDLI